MLFLISSSVPFKGYLTLLLNEPPTQFSCILTLSWALLSVDRKLSSPTFHLCNPDVPPYSAITWFVFPVPSQAVVPTVSSHCNIPSSQILYVCLLTPLSTIPKSPTLFTLFISITPVPFLHHIPNIFILLFIVWNHINMHTRTCVAIVSIQTHIYVVIIYLLSYFNSPLSATEGGHHVYFICLCWVL